MPRYDILTPADDDVQTGNNKLPQTPNASTGAGTGNTTGTFNPPPPLYIDNQGWLETYYQDTITGWASSGGVPAQVDVYIDGKFYAKVTPSIVRLDVGNPNSASKNFGFSYVIPEKGGNKNVGKHEINVLFTGTQQSLTNSPLFYEIKENGGTGVIVGVGEPPVVIIQEPTPHPPKTEPPVSEPPIVKNTHPSSSDKSNKVNIFISKNYKPIVIGLGVIAALLIARKLLKTNN